MPFLKERGVRQVPPGWGKAWNQNTSQVLTNLETRKMNTSSSDLSPRTTLLASPSLEEMAYFLPGPGVV